jgi:hypothetical protein
MFKLYKSNKDVVEITKAVDAIDKCLEVGLFLKIIKKTMRIYTLYIKRLRNWF